MDESSTRCASTHETMHAHSRDEPSPSSKSPSKQTEAASEAADVNALSAANILRMKPGVRQRDPGGA
eukprot:919939-Amphidinium_carterae.1